MASKRQAAVSWLTRGRIAISVPLFYVGLAGVPANLTRWWHAIQSVRDKLGFIQSHPEAWRFVSFVLALGLAFYTQIKNSLKPTLNVELEPTSGPSSLMELRVKNNGKSGDFYAEGSLVRLRHSPNKLRRRVSTLKWEHTADKYMFLGAGESSNLQIARFSIDHKNGFGEMEILVLSNGALSTAESARWTTDSTEKVPEYDLLITIFGTGTKKPVERMFTVRPARWTGPLEMVETGENAAPNPR